MAAVRQHLLLISGRRDGQGEPLKPSRLLFATDSQSAVRRAKAFFSFKGSSQSTTWLHAQDQLAQPQQFHVPEPVDPESVNQLSVTRFREYLKCPYRFYLRYILRLEAVATMCANSMAACLAI